MRRLGGNCEEIRRDLRGISQRLARVLGVKWRVDASEM